MLPKRHYARANGMLEMSGAASGVFAPLVAGALIGPIGLVGILIVDLASAAVAITTLLFAHIPQPPRTEAGRAGAGSFLKETAYGFRYILARPSLLGLQTVFLVGNFMHVLGRSVFAPIINGSNQAIWQAKVAPDVQGRVFATRRLIAWLVMPIGQLLAGPLADRVLEPAMVRGGSLAGSLGWLVGTGSGAGIGLLHVVTGLLIALVGLGAYLFPTIRQAEEILPDHVVAAGLAAP